MAERPGFGSSILSGIESGVGLAQKVEHLQEQRRQVEEQKKQLQLQRGDYLTNKLYKALTLPDAVREDAIAGLQAESEQLQVPLNPAVLKMVKSPEMRTQTLQALADLALLPDDARGQASIAALGMMSASPENFADNLQKYSAERAKIMASRKAGQPTGTDVLNSTEKAINTFKAQAGADLEVVKQVNNLNTIASDPKRRKEAFPGDAAQVVLAKLLDPATGVREGEVARVTGLGTGALDTVRNSFKKAATGQVLAPEQWRQLLAVSNLIAHKSEERMTEFRNKFAPTLQGAGVDPNVVFSGFPKHEMFDFEKEFGKGKVPVGLNTLKKKLTETAEIPEALKKKFADAGLPTDSPEFKKALSAFQTRQQQQQKSATASAAPAGGLSPSAGGAPPLEIEPVAPEENR